MTDTYPKLSKNIRSTKAGETIVVPMGAFLPHAVKVESVRIDEDGQIIGEGIAIEMQGCSSWRVGESMSVCLGWKNV